MKDNPINALWPKGPFYWEEDNYLYVSIPFTWSLPAVRERVQKKNLGLYEGVVVGGPALDLMPHYFDDLPYVAVGSSYPGVLQKVHPLATRTTVGCVRKCPFCGIGKGKIEGGPFRELYDWPDLPVLCDNNLLAASEKHFDRVIERIVRRWPWADFNQGLDARLLTSWHADRLASIKTPIIRLALDAMGVTTIWEKAYACLREAGIAKSNISSYCLIAFTDTPEDAWRRCDWIERHGVAPLPMWYHALDQMEWNTVTLDQQKLGWTKDLRTDIMGYYYRRRGEKPSFLTPADTPA